MIEPRTLYIDPAVGSYIIMSIASIAVPIGAVILMMWRQMKNKFAETLHLEDKFVTEVEGDVVLIEPLDDTDDFTPPVFEPAKADEEDELQVNPLAHLV